MRCNSVYKEHRVGGSRLTRGCKDDPGFNIWEEDHALLFCTMALRDTHALLFLIFLYVTVLESVTTLLLL